MSKAHDAVTKRMAQKVDADKLYMADGTDHHVKLVLELATEIERTRDEDYVMVTMASQREAAAYFNAHGFADTLDHMLTLRDTTNHKG